MLKILDKLIKKSVLKNKQIRKIIFKIPNMDKDLDVKNKTINLPEENE